MNLLLAEQAYFDQHEFDTPLYVELTQSDQKVRHILLHSVKAAGKLAIKRNVEDEVIPDLAIYRSQLINTLKLNTDLMIPYDSSINRRTVEMFGLTEHYYQYSMEELLLANYDLAEFVEPREHGEETDVQLVQSAAIRLHYATTRLAFLKSIDVEASHHQRLEQLLGKPISNPLV